jgi:hypothetical protein
MQALLAAGAIPALMALVSTGSDKCREAAADALAALGDVAARDPAQRELLKLKVLPVLLQLLHTSNHDGTRVSAVAAVKTLTWPPANTDFRCADTKLTYEWPDTLIPSLHARFRDRGIKLFTRLLVAIPCGTRLVELNALPWDTKLS